MTIAGTERILQLGVVLLLGTYQSPLAARAQSNSAWGVSPSAALSNNPQIWTEAMGAAGVTVVRGFHTSKTLSELQPYRDAKLSLSGILMWSPTRTVTLPSSDLAGWKRYVTTQITRYHNVVSSWEVWNEPPNFTQNTSATSYAAVVAAAYDAAKAVDPEVQIGLAAKSVHVRFLAETIAAGARDKFDFISLHPYEVAALIPQGCERTFLGIISNLRAMLRELNPQRMNVPVRFTEISLELRNKGSFPIDEAMQADTLVKIFSMGFAQGVEQVDWFDPRDSENKQHGLLRGDGKPRPAYQAYKQLRTALGRTPKFLGYSNLAADSFGFLFEGPEADVMVAWSPPRAKREVALSSAATLIDPASGSTKLVSALTLTNTARLITTPLGSALSAEWRKGARRERAPWDLSPSTREVTFTPSAAAQAVCVTNTVTLAQHEIDLTNTRGVWFAIEPKFIGYASVPLEVTLIARGHGGRTGGFNLKYESRKPIKAANENGMVVKGQWNTVRGRSPVTFTWQINDASFVSKYGPNLGVDCDGPEYCDFSVLNLTIRKRK